MVTIAAWLVLVPPTIAALLSVVFTVVAPTFFLGGLGGPAADFDTTLLPAVILFTVVQLAIATGFVMMGVGLLRLRAWARTAAVAVFGFLTFVYGLNVVARSLEPVQHVIGVYLGAVCSLLVSPPSWRAFRG